MFDMGLGFSGGMIFFLPPISKYIFKVHFGTKDLVISPKQLAVSLFSSLFVLES